MSEMNDINSTSTTEDIVPDSAEQKSLSIEAPTNQSDPLASSSVNVVDCNSTIESPPKTQTIEDEVESIVEERDYAKKNERSELMTKANNLQCPFVWQKHLCPKIYGDHDIDLVNDCNEMFEETGFKFRRFIINTVFCYHNFYKRLADQSMKNLEELENMLSVSSKKENSDYIFNRINDALFHVTHSCRIYILRETNQIEKAIAVIRKIKSYESMDKPNQAGIWAIRANVFVEYGYEGVKSAVAYIKKAIELDAENPYWHFMKGMYLGRLRRIEDGFAIPSTEELNSLMSAIHILKDGSFYAFAAEVYLETSLRAKKSCNVKFSASKECLQTLNVKLDQFNKMAAEYFVKSIDLKRNCAHLMFRCGKGLMKLPPPYQNFKLAAQFFRRGLELSPKSSYGNHAMAMYVEKIEKDPQKAKKYLNISINRNNFPAHLDMLRIKFNESEDVNDTIEDLKEMLKMYTELPKRRRVLGEIVCTFLFLEYDLPEACSAMKELITINTKTCRIINDFHSQILPVSIPIRLLDIILGQIKRELSRKNIDDMEVNIYKQFIQICIEEDLISNASQGLFDEIKNIVRKAMKDRKMDQEKVRSEQKRRPIDFWKNDDEKYLKYYRYQPKERACNEDVRKLKLLICKRAAGKRDEENLGKRRHTGSRESSEERSSQCRSSSQSYSDETQSSSNSCISSDYESKHKHRDYRKKSHRSRSTSRSSSRNRKSRRHHSSRNISESKYRRNRRRSRSHRSGDHESRSGKKEESCTTSSSEENNARGRKSNRNHTPSYSSSVSRSSSSASVSEWSDHSRKKSKKPNRPPSRNSSSSSLGSDSEVKMRKSNHLRNKSNKRITYSRSSKSSMSSLEGEPETRKSDRPRAKSSLGGETEEHSKKSNDMDRLEMAFNEIIIENGAEQNATEGEKCNADEGTSKSKEEFSSDKHKKMKDKRKASVENKNDKCGSDLAKYLCDDSDRSSKASRRGYNSEKNRKKSSEQRKSSRHDYKNDRNYHKYEKTLRGDRHD